MTNDKDSETPPKRLTGLGTDPDYGDDIIQTEAEMKVWKAMLDGTHPYMKELDEILPPVREAGEEPKPKRSRSKRARRKS